MMNAARHDTPTLGTATVEARRDTADAGSHLSAFVDGELAAHELDALLQALADDADMRSTCERYRVIGDVLRDGVVNGSTQPAYAFVAGVRGRLQAERADALESSPTIHLRAPAANDPVFRWKMVAGLASLAAVMAVSWIAIGQAPEKAGGAVAGPQLAMSEPMAQPVAAVTQSQGAISAVLVDTPRGRVLRDPRLEQLLAEHRQYGGMSALQMPAGFLRDATHQAEPQR